MYEVDTEAENETEANVQPEEDGDGGVRISLGANKKIPMRQCVGCQEMKNKKEMIRMIRTT